jgi:hypothetical protein
MATAPLSMNVGDPVARAKAKPPAPKAEAPAAPRDLMTRYTEAMAKPEKELKEATASEQQFKMAQEQDVAARTAERLRARGTALEAEKAAVEDSRAMRGLADVESQMEVPFTPSQETAMDLATLYSLIGVVGFAIGVGGKGNAMAAMSAMNGMAEGHRAGRMDLYAKEKDQFDTNMKQLKTRADTLGRELERITKLAAYDRQKAELEADALFAEQGANFMKEYTAKYGLPKSLELAKQNVQAAQKMFELQMKQEETARNKAEEREFRLRLAAMEANVRRDIAAMRNDGKVGLKPGDKKTEGYVADNQLLADVGFMKQQLQDPELQQLVKQYRVEGFLSEEGGKAVSQLLQTEMPPKLRKFLTSVRDVRNNYYLAISGKAVTGGEALRNYGTVPQPGDSPEVMVDKMDALERRVAEKIKLTRTLYPSLPPLIGALQPLQPTGLRPNEDYSRETTQNYYLNNRKIVPRGDKWVYEDDGTEAK